MAAVAPAAAAAARAQTTATDSVVYVLSPASRFDVTTGKAGLLGFAGHEHVVRAHAFAGRIVYYAGTPAASHVEIVVQTDSLIVLTPPDTAEIRKVTVAMKTQVLDVAHYPEIRLVSRSIRPGEGRMHMIGALTIKGETRELPLDIMLEMAGDTLRATATFAVKQTDFAIRPYRGGPGGTVRVADRVAFEIHAVAVRAGP